VVVMTAILVMTAGDLRRLLRHVDAMLPDCAQALREARRTLGTTRRLVLRATHLARSVEGVVKQACQAAAETISDVLDLRAQARRFLGKWNNGARPGPRRVARG